MVTAEAPNSRVKCLPRPSHGGVTRYTVPSSQRPPRGRAQTLAYSLLKTLRFRHCIGSTWSWEVTGGPARVLSYGHKSGVSSTFNRKVKELASRQTSRKLQSFPRTSYFPVVASGVVCRHHPAAPKPPPVPLGIECNSVVFLTIQAYFLSVKSERQPI